MLLLLKSCMLSTDLRDSVRHIAVPRVQRGPRDRLLRHQRSCKGEIRGLIHGAIEMHLERGVSNSNDLFAVKRRTYQIWNAEVKLFYPLFLIINLHNQHWRDKINSYSKTRFFSFLVQVLVPSIIEICNEPVWNTFIIYNLRMAMTALSNEVH